MYSTCNEAVCVNTEYLGLCTSCSDIAGKFNYCGACIGIPFPYEILAVHMSLSEIDAGGKRPAEYAQSCSLLKASPADDQRDY